MNLFPPSTSFPHPRPFSRSEKGTTPLVLGEGVRERFDAKTNTANLRNQSPHLGLFGGDEKVVPVSPQRDPAIPKRMRFGTANDLGFVDRIVTSPGIRCLAMQ